MMRIALSEILTPGRAGRKGLPGLSLQGNRKIAFSEWSAQVVLADYFVELDPGRLFPGREELPLELDLGCGDGRFLMEMARAFPERNFLGVERVKGRVHLVSERIRRSGMRNVRILRLDAGYVVGWQLSAASVSRVHFLFPDPWPKKRHHKNRIVRSEEFLHGLGRVLKPGGEFLHKTDQEDYFLEAGAGMRVQSWAEELGWESQELGIYPETDFERQWICQGRSICRGRWRRGASGLDEASQGSRPGVDGEYILLDE